MLDTTQNDVLDLDATNTVLLKVKNYIQSLHSIASSDKLVKYIQSDFTSICTTYFNITEVVNTSFDSKKYTDINQVYQILYSVPEVFKDFAILHRDIALQLQIATFKLLNTTDEKEKIEAHFLESKQVLLDAASALEHSILSGQNNSKERLEKASYALQHYKNPWSVYKSQIEDVKLQIKQIVDNNFFMSKTISVFKDIKQSNTAFLDQITEDTSTLLKHTNEAIKTVKDIKTIEDITPVIKWIDQTLLSQSKVINIQEDYAASIETKIKKLSTGTVPVSTNEGLLLTKTIDFNKTVKKWFDFEILPILIDLIEQKITITTFFKHSLMNLKSGLTVEKNNNSLNAIPSQIESLKNVHATLNENSTKVDKTVTSLKNTFAADFNVTTIYLDQPFLEVTIQSSLSQMATDHSNFFTMVKDKIYKQFNYLNTKLEQTNLFSDQNKIEDSIQCINYRMFKEVNANYDNLFLNKNFIGNLFLSPRQKQEASIENSVAQWNNGFGKAIVITGDKLSGKSTFVDYIGQKYFGKSTLILKKDTTITFDGRKFKTTHNLKDALHNIKKGFSNTKPLIVIDNLELWNDDDFSLLDNVRALLSFISSESDNALILVTTSRQMQQHLDNRIRFTEAFSNTIKLDKATFEEIYKAVLLRHGASHKTLISKKHDPLSPKQIKQNVLKLSKKLDYNLGEVLQAWTYGTTLINNNKVVYEDADPGFKDFLNKEEVIILKHLLLFNKITEIQLKKFVGKSYETQYKVSLKRLLSTKVLLRDNDGQLRLNPVITKDIKQLLIYRGILN